MIIIRLFTACAVIIYQIMIIIILFSQSYVLWGFGLIYFYIVGDEVAAASPVSFNSYGLDAL